MRILSIILGILLLASQAYGVVYKTYSANSLIGGVDGSLDNKDGTELRDGDIAIVVTSTVTYHYMIDGDSGLAESSPGIIAPDTNAGTKRWILKEVYLSSTELTDTADLLYEAELDTFSELQTQIADETLLKAGTLTDTYVCTWNLGGTDIVCNTDPAGLGGGSGDVVGPGSSTDNAVARFDSTTGKLLQNSVVTIDDNGKVIVPTGSSAGYWFGDGDSGIYENGDDRLDFWNAGAVSFYVDSVHSVIGNTTDTWKLFGRAATATSPVFAFSTDGNTGIGRASADQLSWIAGGAEVVRLDANAGADAVKVNVQNATDVGLNIEAAAAQSANLFEINTLSGTGGDILNVEGNAYGRLNLIGTSPKLTIYPNNVNTNSGMDVNATHFITYVQDGSYNFNARWDQSADNTFEFTHHASTTNGLDDTNGRQAFLYLEPKVTQTSTAAFDGIYLNVKSGATFGDGSTGDGNNLINLAVGGTSMFSVDNAGMVGINRSTTAPSAQLDVYVKDATTVGTIIEAAAAQSANLFEINSNGGSGGDLLKVNSSGSIYGQGWSIVTDDAIFDNIYADRNFISTTPQWLAGIDADYLSVGPVYLFNSHATSAMTRSSSGKQEFMELFVNVEQGGTVSYDALFINIVETSIGSGDSNIINAEVGGTSVYRIDRTGASYTTAGQSLGMVTASKSGAYTIGTDDARECYGGIVYVTSAATITACDALDDNMNFTVITIGAIAVSLDVQADDKMYLDGTLLDDGDKADNTSTTGDKITCAYFSADGWFCASNSWTDGG